MLLGAWAWSNIRGKIYQDWENWVFDRSVRGQSATFGEYAGEKRNEIIDAVTVRFGSHRREKPPAVQPQVAAAPAKRPSVPRNGDLVGRLVVPRLHLRAVVREGTGEDTLTLALGHIPGTALPGQNGNVGVAGHRDTLFRSLREIRKNDLIQFQTVDGNHVYEVRSTEVVSPQSVSVLDASEYPEITLVTCYPFNYVGPAPDRFIVKAREVGGDSPAAQPAKFPNEVAKGEVPPEQQVPATAPQERQASRARPNKVAFEVTERHSRELARGISFGLSRTDPSRQSVTGWMWVMPERRTIWLHNQRVNEAVVFYGYRDGKARKLVITNVASRSVKGYLVMPEDSNNARTSN